MTSKVQDYSYIGEIHIGTPFQTVLVSWDTAALETFIYDCAYEDYYNNCGIESTYYTPEDSSTYAEYSEEYNYHSINFTNGYTTGIRSTERFCPVLDSASCTSDDFVFLLADWTYQQGIEGNIGLASGNVLY